MLELRPKKENWFTTCWPWLTPERAWRIAEWNVRATLVLALITLVATVVRLEPHARAYWEAHIPAWLMEMREARDQRLMKQEQEQERQSTP